MFQAYVENIGHIGAYDTKADAIEAALQTISNSGLAGDYGFVLEENGCQVEAVWEYGTPSD